MESCSTNMKRGLMSVQPPRPSSPPPSGGLESATVAIGSRPIPPARPEIRCAYSIVLAFEAAYRLAATQYEERDRTNANEEALRWNWRDSTEQAMRKAKDDFITLVARDLSL